jgi:hypothetical protein
MNMTTFYGQTSNEYDVNPMQCGNSALNNTVGLEHGSYNRTDGLLQVSFETMKARIERRHGVQAMQAAAVGDFIELFDVPVYSSIKSIAVNHDCDTKGFKFDIEVVRISGTPAARVATPIAGLTAFHDIETGTTVTNGTAAAALANIGAATGRESFHFSPAPRNNHKAVIRLKVTALPAVGTNLFDLSTIAVFAKFDLYGVNTCATCENAYDKNAVATVS